MDLISGSLFDTHCHIDSPEFDPDREAVLICAQQSGVNRIVVPATTAPRWSNLLSICNVNPMLYPAIGLHPVYLEQHRSNDIQALKSLVNETKIIAVGEIGLDYYLKHLDRDKQLALFEAQLGIAASANLPVILHCRKAYDDLITLVKQYALPGGIAHAFNGSIQQAHKLIELGFKLGFGGMLTFERSRKLRKLAQSLPDECLVLETDSPDLTVSQYRGERNSPAYLPYVLEALALLRKQPQQQIAELTYGNSLEVFAIKD